MSEELLEWVAVTVTVTHPLAADLALTITLAGRVLSAIDHDARRWCLCPG